MGLLHLQEALLNVHPYISFISSHRQFINRLFYVSTKTTFKQVVSNENHFTIFHSFYYDAKL
jgi:hypothetical protein